MKKIVRVVLLTLLPLLPILLLVGCANIGDLTLHRETRSLVEGRRLAVAETPADVLKIDKFSPEVLIGIAYHTDEEIVKEHRLDAAAAGTANRLAALVAEKYHMQAVNRSPVPGIALWNIGGREKILRQSGPADLILSTSPVIGLDARAMSPDHYDMTFVLSLNLIDAATEKNVARGDCTYNSARKKEVAALTWDEWFGDHAARFKAELNDAKDFCVSQIMKDDLSF